MQKCSNAPKNYHSPQILSSREEELLTQYQRGYRLPKDRMQPATNSLSAGERDALEAVREALTWASILSLAYKYYPLYPNRKWWLEALRRAQKWARFVNIRYLLLTLRSIKREKMLEQQRTMEGLSIDTDYNKEKAYQLIQTNQRRLEARRLAKLVLAAEGGELG
ncbi:unnamed protein product [marine sediment metagenome]|uniref:Uncharacterized protein n=1 Tax=marine sediment metagenome TaxID=412755 RepID=X1L8E2_9ZZZZ